MIQGRAGGDQDRCADDGSASSSAAAATLADRLRRTRRRAIGDGYLERDRERLAAVRFACRESAREDAAVRPSRWRALVVARDRRAEGFRRGCARPSWYAWLALRRVRADARPFAGGFSFTPARRAFERPMAIACFVERAPCLPLLT
jgi:hypothetical protein